MSIAAILMTDLGSVGPTFARFVGEVALLTVAAVVLGYATYKVVPKGYGRDFVAGILPFLMLGVLSYLGSIGAAVALVLFVIIAGLAFALGIG
jgi:hypothetical protein